MDFMNLLIVIVGLGSAAVIAFVVIYAGAVGLSTAWNKIADRRHAHHAH
jgi:hypothetical protein